MIGRAMRGPRAKGSKTAHILHLLDDWDGAPDLLNPIEVIPYATTAGRHLPGRPEHLMPPLLDADDEPIPPAIEAELRRFQSERKLARTITKIIGYYIVDERLVPVMTHQQDAFLRVIDAAKINRQGYPAIREFDDVPDPIPTKMVIDEFIRYVRAHRTPPEFVPLETGSSVIEVADELERDSRSEQERDLLIRERYEHGLARAAFSSLAEFHNAVESERARRRFGGLDDAMPMVVKPGKHRLPPGKRELQTLLDEVIAWVIDHLPHLADRIEPIPDIDWSARANGSLFGSWAPVRGRSSPGAGRIRINRVFATTEAAVSDEMLKYLIYHELLHHILPTNGHDQFFRSLEERWPDAAEHDLRYDTLHERWDMRPDAYR
jgi:hypothetical protein